MRSSVLCVIAIITAGASLPTPAQQYFLESAWQNSIPAESVAIWAGGNVGTNSAAGLPVGTNPIMLIGFNRDVVVERTADWRNNFNYADAFEPATQFAFYEAGLNAVPYTYTGGNPTLEGLPQDGSFTSMLDGSTTFQLQPYNTNNVLYLNRTAPTGTLSLVTPAAYQSISVLATSAGGGGAGYLIIQFSNHAWGRPIPFNAPDWFDNPGAALTHFGRIYPRFFDFLNGRNLPFRTDNPVGNNPNLYQTTINLAEQGYTSPIVSVTFIMPDETPTNTVTGIFALSGSVYSPPVSTNDLKLADTAIGQTTAQTFAYPGAEEDQMANAVNLRIAGSRYRYDEFNRPIPAVDWPLRFSGGIDPATGVIYDSTATNVTYFPVKLDQAEHALRCVLRMEPFNTNAARQLVLLAEDRMRPLEFCGTEAIAYAAKARILGLTQNGTNLETLAIAQARSYFRSACDVLPQFLANPTDAALVENQNPLLSPFVTNEVAQVLDAYLRNLAQYARVSLSDFQIRNLEDFRDPAQRAASPRALLNEIDNVKNEIQLRLLLASPFQALPAYTLSAVGEVQSLLRDLGRLHESIVLGRITFVAAAGGNAATNSTLCYGEYTTSFVPIFPGIQTSGNSSFDTALSLANDMVQYATGLEATAKDSVNQVIQRNYDYRDEENKLQQTYVGELLELCGYAAVDIDGNPMPDVFFAALPPGARETTPAQYVSNGNYHLAPDRTGTIYQQWGAFQTAQTNLALATLQLNNILAEMQTKEQVGLAIYTNELGYAALVQTNGEKIAGIDLQKGEVQAQADLQIAQEQSDAAKEQAHRSSWLGVIATVRAALAARFTAGASLAVAIGAGFSSGANAYSTVANAYQSAATATAIGNVQANTARQLAAFDAQVEKIKTDERAALQYMQADETLLRLSENLNSLRLQASSQELQIQLAAQNVDQERNKLANLLARAGYLLQQYSRSVNLLDSKPEFADDLLIARNKEIQQADDAFLLAQQWAFLAAQAFAYKDNSQNTSAPSYVRSVLAARNTASLGSVLMTIKNANASVLLATYTNAPNFDIVPFSVRNDFVQANLTQGSGTNTDYVSYEPNAFGNSSAASKAAWVDYLKSHIRTNQFGSVFLQIDFSTTLGRLTINGYQRNPLWKCDNFGGLLFSGKDQNENLYKGVQISVTTSGLSFTDPRGASAGFWVHLSQIGTSSIRRVGFGNQTGDPTRATRFFNFGAFSVEFTASANNLNGSPGSDAFSERSPANDHWQLVINADEAGNNSALLTHLDQLADIELQFAVRSFTDSTANYQCSLPSN
jgi:hypothetical protein